MDIAGAHFGINSLPIQLDTLGTVFSTIKIIAEWSILNVNYGGCFLPNNSSKAYIPYKNYQEKENKLICEDWELELKDGWIIKQYENNYKIIKNIK